MPTIMVSDKFTSTIEKIKSRTGATSNKEAVEFLLDFYDTAMIDVEKGGQVVVKDKSGWCTQYDI